MTIMSAIRCFSLVIAGSLTLLMPQPGQAQPALPAKPPQGLSDLHNVHACHRSCEFGPVRGWHRHGAGCQPLACIPRAANPNRCFVDRFGVRHCRW
jgi:hypothetical protein